MSIFNKNPRNWHPLKGQPLTEMDKRILWFQNKGKLCPSRELIKTPEQIEGIRRAGKLNTALLDHVTEKIHEGMTTAEIDRIVYDFTTAHGGIPAPLNYEGFPKSVCVSKNDVVCHGIPSEDEVLEVGDIVNVDVTTILDGYFADASRMFIISKTTAERERLVRVAKECLDIGAEVCKPYTFVGDMGNAIAKHAHKNGFTIVRDLCGHGVGNAFHEDPDVEHYGKKGSGMLLVPGMVFTIEPMVNAGDWEVVVDEEDGWTVYTEDYSDSAQWEHTFLMTEEGLEVITY
jgi:methionyl aminopeptidase